MPWRGAARLLGPGCLRDLHEGAHALGVHVLHGGPGDDVRHVDPLLPLRIGRSALPPPYPPLPGARSRGGGGGALTGGKAPVEVELQEPRWVTGRQRRGPHRPRLPGFPAQHRLPPGRRPQAGRQGTGPPKYPPGPLPTPSSPGNPGGRRAGRWPAADVREAWGSPCVADTVAWYPRVPHRPPPP